MATKNFSAVINIGAQLGTTFRAAFGGANKEIEKLGQSIRDSSAGQRGIKAFSAASMEAAAAQAAMRAEMSKLLDLQKQSGYVTTVEELNQLNGEIDAQRLAVTRAKTAVEKKNAALEKERVTMKKAGIDTRNLSGEMERLARESDTAERRLRALTAIRGANLGGAFRTAARDVAVAGGIIAGTATAIGLGLFKLTKSVADAGDELGETASALGLAGTALQGFRYASERVGLDADKLDIALEKMNSGLRDAVENGGKMEDVFSELGLDSGMLEFMTTDQRLLAIADAFKNYSGVMDKAGLATDIFGTKAYRMRNVLELGSKGIAALTREAAEAGYILGPEMQKRADEFDNSFGRLKATVLGVRNAIGGELMPVFTEFFTSVASDIRLHGKEIREWAVDFAATIHESLPAIVSFTKTLFVGLGRIAVVANKVASAMGGWENVFLAFSAIVAAKAVVSLFMLGKSLWTVGAALGTLISTGLPAATAGFAALGAAIGATPVGWIAAALVAAAILIYKYWEPIKALFSGMFEGSSEVIAGIIEDFRPLFGVFGAIKDAIAAILEPLGLTTEQFSVLKDVGKVLGKYMTYSVLWPIKAISFAVRGLADSFQHIKTLFGILSGDSSPGSAVSAPGGEVPAASQAVKTGGKKSSIQQTNSIVIQTQPGQDPGAIVDEWERRQDELNSGAMFDTEWAGAS